MGQRARELRRGGPAGAHGEVVQVRPRAGCEPVDDPVEQRIPATEQVGGGPRRQPGGGVDGAVRHRPHPLLAQQGDGGIEEVVATAAHDGRPHL
jgi:hypothetical protein